MYHIEYKDGYKYQLEKPYSVLIPIHPEKDINTDYVRLDVRGHLRIIRSYAWDGPSGPTVDTKNFTVNQLIVFYKKCVKKMA